MITTYINETYRITHNAVNIVENALDNPNLVQISVANNCTILLAPQPSYGINYKANGEYASWSLTGVNTRINKKEAHYIYARLNREDSNAMLVFSINNYTTDGKIVEDPDSAASENYYYIKVGSITATDAVGNEATVKREVRYDGGYLGTPQSNQSDESGWKKMFVLTADNLINALKHFASFTVQGTLNILGHLSINGKQISDVAREVDETPPEDDYTIPTLAYLKGKFVELLSRYFLRKDQDDTAEGTITFLKDILFGKKGHGITISESNVVTAILDELKNVFSVVSPDFVSGDLGNGYVLKYDQKTGRSYLEVDELLVRKLAYFVELIIKRLSHVGGEIILTPASLKCSKVEVYDTYYRCYFEQDDGDKSIVQEFKAGDQARCQTFNVQEGTSHNVSNTYYWRLVTATGKNYIDLSIEDCDLGSMEPSAGDHIVQIGNRTDATRQNAIILSTVGDDAPSIKQYKGINGYTLRNKEVTILSPTLNKFLGQFISEVTGKSYDDMFSDLQADFDIVKAQVDREFTIWFFEYAPTLSNIPAVEWTTDALKALHEQDMFYNRASGLAYRFEKNANGAYSWNSITDQQTVKALEDAAKAQDTADGKRRVFVSQPTNEKAYDIGDLWVNATYSGSGVNYSNDTLRCVSAKAVGAAFSISHWTPASNATTAYIKNLGDSILLTVGANDTEAKRLISVAQKAADAAGITADAAKATGETNATAIKQNRDSISVVAGRFNSDGTLKNTSGLVTGNGTFATLFANAVVDGKIVKQADISTFITADQAGNLISNASIRADKVVFEGTSVKIASKYLDITGAVTFNSFNADLQGTINGKATTGYVDTAKTDAINSAASTAQSKVDALSNTLGSLAYKSAVEKAMLGTTIINGGYIQASLINSDWITAKHLAAVDGTVGGLKIQGNGLTNEGFNNDAYIVFRNDTNKTFAGIGGNLLPATLGGISAVARFTNDRVINDNSTTNIGLYVGASGSNYDNIALTVVSGRVDIPGVLKGMCFTTVNNAYSLVYKYGYWGNWSISYSNNSILITHNLGHTRYYVVGNVYGDNARLVSFHSFTANSFRASIFDTGGNRESGPGLVFAIIGDNR